MEGAKSAGKFSGAGQMADRRERHGAVLLPDGRILTVSGRGRGVSGLLQSGYWTPTSETYDPASGKWTISGQVNVPRVSMGIALLGDGRVLILAGSGEQRVALDSAEIWDPASGTWSPTKDMT